MLRIVWVVHYHLHVCTVMAFVYLLEQVFNTSNRSTGLDVEVRPVLFQQVTVIWYHKPVVSCKIAYLYGSAIVTFSKVSLQNSLKISFCILHLPCILRWLNVSHGPCIKHDFTRSCAPCFLQGQESLLLSISLCLLDS